MRGSDSTVGTQGSPHLVGLESAVTPTRRWRTWLTSCLLLCGRSPGLARFLPVLPGARGLFPDPAPAKAPPAHPQASQGGTARPPSGISGAGLPPLERRLAALVPYRRFLRHLKARSGGEVWRAPPGHWRASQVTPVRARSHLVHRAQPVSAGGSL